MFSISRALPLGVIYPFDWGFIPGTRGEDGDPLDAMALHEAASYPGVRLPCRILGMVEVIQRDGKGKPEINNRIIALPDPRPRSSVAAIRTKGQRRTRRWPQFRAMCP